MADRVRRTTNARAPPPDLCLPPARFCFSLMGRALQLVLLYDDDGAFNNSLQIASFGLELEFTAT